jgi:hypothetical protein
VDHEECGDRKELLVRALPAPPERIGDVGARHLDVLAAGLLHDPGLLT